MTTEPTKPVESTGHRMATRLDVLAAALYAERSKAYASMPSQFGGGHTSHGQLLAMAYYDAAEAIAELDRIEQGRPA